MFGSFVHRRLLAAVPAERVLAQLGLLFGLVAWLFVDWNVHIVVVLALIVPGSVLGWRHATRL